MPSNDAVAMYILLEGVLGTCCGSRGFLAVAAGLGAVPDCRDSGREPVIAPAAAIAREATSALVGFGGGGKGDIETFVTEAEWAW